MFLKALVQCICYFLKRQILFVYILNETHLRIQMPCSILCSSPHLEDVILPFIPYPDVCAFSLRGAPDALSCLMPSLVELFAQLLSLYNLLGY